MGIFSLLQLFLVLFTFYAVVKYEGGMRVLVPIICLIAVFLLERLQARLKEEKEAKRRLLKYKLEDYKKKEGNKLSKGGA